MPLIGTEGHCIIWIYCNFCFVANELIKVSWLISYAYCVGCCSCSCGRALQLNKNKDNTYSHISKHKLLFVLHQSSEQLHIVILFMTFHKFSVNSGRLSSMSYAVYCWNSPKGLSLQTVWAYFPPAKPVFHLSDTQTPQQLHQLTMVARAQARTTMTWMYSAPWCPTPSPRPHPQLSFLR